MGHGLEQFIKLAPPVWPVGKRDVEPGNLDLFAPMGNGLGNPPVFLPWDDFNSFSNRGNYYGFHPHVGHPFRGAPITESGGGTVYFASCPRAQLDALLNLMEVYDAMQEYGAFVQTSTSNDDGYLTQMRLVGKGALRYLFHVSDAPESQALWQQSLTLGDALWKFIEWHWREYAADRYGVAGALGGDGDWAKESLAFGFMVENQYHAIYRIWTRAWLVTK